ncbi:MAG TPA: hypothetical protein VKP30_19875 [Polyangiaceae bacterium]|nr:hypothetical protein [Polyangiaceae bacterium]
MAGSSYGGAGESTAGNGGIAGGGEAGSAIVNGRIALDAPVIVRTKPLQSTKVEFTLLRSGLGTEVTVKASGLPNGVTATDATIAEGSSFGSLILLVSDPTLVGGPFPFTLQATATGYPNVSSEKLVDMFIAQGSGQLDTSFGSSGIVAIRAAGGDSDLARDVATDASGRTLVVGCGKSAAGELGWVTRLTREGAYDGTFAGGALTNIGALPSCVHRVVERGGASAVWVVESNAGSTASFIRKLNDVGATDNTFGASRNGDVLLASAVTPLDLLAFPNGIVTLAAPGNRPAVFDDHGLQSSSFAPPANLVAQKIAVDSKGRIIYGWVSSTGFAFGRLTATGQLDSGFGSGGLAPMYPFPSGATSGKLAALMLAPDEGFYALVETSGGTSKPSAVSVLAYASDGLLDVKYSASGRRPITENGTAYDAIVDPTGHVIAMYGELNSATQQMMIRLSSTFSGYTEGAFGTAGQVDVTNAVPNLAPLGLTQDPYGARVVVYGSAGANAALVRYWL